MNDRIKDLSQQAKNYAESKLKDGYAYDEIHFFYEEKFANLIIQECSVALSPMLRDMISRGQAFNLIQKHFSSDTKSVNKR
jgi:hypothetical protein